MFLNCSLDNFSILKTFAPSKNELCDIFIVGGDKVSRGVEALACTSDGNY